MVVAGSRPGLPSPGQQLAAHPVELTAWPHRKLRRKMPRVMALDRAAQSAGRNTSASCSRPQRRRHQRHHLVARVRPPRGSPRSRRRTSSGRPRCRARVRKEQPGIGHQRSSDIGHVAWQNWVLLFRGRFFATKPLSQKHRSTFLPLQDANPTSALRIVQHHSMAA